MIEFERSFDYELIRQIMTYSQSIYDKISDDYSPPREQFRPYESDAIWYVIVRDDREVLGLWMLHPQTSVCWEIHTVLLPCAWGARGMQAALELPDWIWEHTTCRRIITNVPSSNRLALKFAIAAQMKVYGVNEASYLKNGVLCEQVCLGISAPAEEWRAAFVRPDCPVSLRDAPGSRE